MHGKNQIPNILVLLLSLTTFLLLTCAYLSLIGLSVPVGSFVSIAFSLMALVTGGITVVALKG